MNLESQDPDRRLDEFRQRTNAMLDELLADLTGKNERREAIAFQPEVDLVETDADFRFYLSIPGMVEDDLTIDVDGPFLTIRGERQPPYDPSVRKAPLKEWRYGFFERHFELSSLIEVTSIRAHYDAGVLTIVATKLTPKQPRDNDSFNQGTIDIEEQQ